MKQNNQPLNEIGDKTVFKVPENYFEDFQAKLDERLDALKTEKDLVKKDVHTKRFLLNMDSIKPILYMAAMFVLLVFSVSQILNLTSGKSSSPLGLSVDSNSKSVSTIPSAEDYLINSVGTYGITEYYVDSENFE